MARIRTIKPEFWTDERVGECSVRARLLFLATWTFSDDHGGLDRSSKQLKAQAFPYDDIDCEPLVQELIQAGLLIEYETDGKKYLHIKGFRTHQKVEKPARPRVPLYEGSDKTPRVLPESSPSPPRLVAVSSLECNGREGRRGENAATAADPPKVNGKGKAAKVSVPPDFALDPELAEYAEQRLALVDAPALFESFCGKARAKGWVYVNWRQAFQEFVRNCAPESGHWAAGQYPKKHNTKNDPPGFEAVRW